MKYSSSLILSLLLLSTSGCAKVWNSNSGSTAPQASDAAVGAGIGAAVGGGLGLLVGSTSGAPAEGLLVGSLAGGALGAGIGAQVNKENKNSSDAGSAELTEEQKDILKRSQKIKQQNIEIDELKRNTSDSAKSSQPVINKKVMEASLGTDITPTKPTSTRAYTTTTTAKTAEPRARFTSTKTNAGSIEYLSKRSGEKSSIPYGETEAVTTVSTNEYKKEIPESIKKTTEVITAKKEEAKIETAKVERKIQTLPAAATETKEKATEVAKSTIKQPKDLSNCKDAVKEAERGLNSPTDADKMFYLRRASRLCPTEPTYHVELGKMLSSVGKRDDAKYEFRQAIDLDPSNQVARDELSSLENSSNINKK